jgi:hypothetical protein
MPINQLRRLLNTLTESEIKYFRQYAHRHIASGKTSYLKLFELMVDSKHLSDAEVRKQFYPALSPAGLLSLKKYLYNLVLKTLVSRREETHVFPRLLKELSMVEILNDKMLYDDAIKKLQKIRNETSGNDLYCLTLVAYWFEEVMMRSIGYSMGLTADAARRNAAFVDFADKVNNQIKLGALFSYYAILNRSGLVKTEEEKRLQEIFHDPLLDDHASYDLIAAQRSYMVMKQLQARFHGDKQLSFQYIRQLHHILMKFPSDFFYHESSQIFSTCTLAIYHLERAEFGPAEKLLAQLRSMNPHTGQNKYMLFRMKFQVELLLLRAQGKHEQCLDAIMKYESQAKAMRGKLFNILEYRNFQSIISYLLSRNLYRECLSFINTILNDSRIKKKGVPYQLYAQIMNLIVHYELNNQELLESSIRSFEYYISKNHVNLEFIKHTLIFFRAVSRSRNRFKDELEKYGKALIPLLEIPVEKVNLFDLIDSGWLQQKGIPIKASGLRPMLM